jgi:hypothetical protein
MQDNHNMKLNSVLFEDVAKLKCIEMIASYLFVNYIPEKKLRVHVI